ncbi:Pentatricopeptide repeat-containing protein [Spatholobus suberectus]|nr:Pentatricopeptide repeat-containing protein [Spatholobus suberectus]
MVSLDSTLKACLWEMGSPFLPCKTRHGVLVAKAHSLRMWLKDSPFCLDLELKDAPNLPESNSMQLIEGCFVRCGLVPAFKEITEKLEIVSPKKFSRLALLPDDQRSKTIEAYTEGRKEKLEKSKKIVDPKQLKKIRMVKKLKRRKHFREASIPNAIGKQRTFKPMGAERAT